ncbi:MAG: MATE family efflux transporter [Erysipelotrichaceae bacterium]|jgi:putative MATE family efflux protein|nr:MATE family efflux transporter [Bacillota bacterium]NLP22563.1 MATE family efflux transporter [Erysipelotrichaceae bacterium]
MNLKKYIGNKKFYKKSASMALPLMFQQVLAGAMGIVDTIMVSWIGMVSAVGTASQIDILSGMINYGIIGGTSMFSAQFYGANDYKNLRRTFGLSVVLAFINGFFWFLVASFFGSLIMKFYIDDSIIIENALKYLNISKFYLIISGINFAFAATYRSMKQSSLTLKISFSSMLINTVLNYLLIYGVGPFPKLGVQGAAIATVIAMLCSNSFYLIHALYTKQPFLGPINEMFHFEKKFILTITKKIIPLVINEALFGFGNTLFIKAFGQLGKTSMDAYYVSFQISNLFNAAIYGYGSAVQSLLGNILGAGKIEKAKEESNYHFGLSFMMSVILVISMIVFSKPLVAMFNLKDPITNSLAVSLLFVFALKVSMRLFNFVIFSILRSGGDVNVLQFLDSGIEWLVGLPLAFISVNVFKIESIVIVLLITQLEQLVRLIFGLKRVFKYIWAEDLTVLVEE